MTLEFFIRAASNDDIPSIKNVVFTVLKEYGLEPDEIGKDNDLNDIEKNYFSPNGYFGVLTNAVNGEIIGTFGLFTLDDSTCELRKMYLLKPWRGKSLGKRMLERAIYLAREKKYQRIVLETISPLKEAIALYKKYGFVEIEPKEVNNRVDRAFEFKLN